MEIINKLFLELAQVTNATTPREARLQKAVALLSSMVESGESHSDESRRIVAEAFA